MNMLLLHLKNTLLASWTVLLQAAPYLIFGFFIAALLKAFIKTETITRYLGPRSMRSVFLASLFGVPIPLCSCGVIPAAAALRKEGASKASIISFLISTPESGVDSIAVTYALIDPVMAVMRPVAAFSTAMAAGAVELFFGDKSDAAEPVNDHHCAHCDHHDDGGSHKHSLGFRLLTGLRFAFVELMDDIAGWFLIGLIVAGVISYAVPASIVERYLGDPWLSMIIMLIVGMPLYVCATASTPIVAALMWKGMSPGAAIVFLLAGPATNAASIGVVAKMIGKRGVAIYLVTIAVMSLLFGAIVNWLYASFYAGYLMVNKLAEHHHSELIPPALSLVAAVVLLTIMVLSVLRKRLR